MNNLSEKEVRNMVREMLMSDEISESDAIYPKEQDWATDASKLRKLMVDLLKNIENDEYIEGLVKIDSVIYKLKSWKNKIRKFID